MAILPEMPNQAPTPVAWRRQQILAAALACFARKGLHQTTMHDISTSAGISVGLIYRYFVGKEAVIEALADDYREDLQAAFERAGRARSLVRAQEILFTMHQELPGRLKAHLVLNLYAESVRSPRIARLLNELDRFFLDHLTVIVAGSSEWQAARPVCTAREMAEVLHHCRHGLFFAEALTEEDDPRPGDGQASLSFLQRLCGWLLPAMPSAPTVHAHRTGSRRPARRKSPLANKPVRVAGRRAILT